MSATTKAKFLGFAETCARLGVPRAWLRAEAEAGRVPCLRAGRRLLFDIEAVEQALAERAEATIAR